MITFEQAYQIVMGLHRDFGSEEVTLENSLGRILKEDWYTDRDLPPYDRVTMDGIALQYNDSFGPGQRLKIEGVAAAGSPQMTLTSPNNCIEVMTGTILPKGTDTVIRYEDLKIETGVAVVNADFLPHQNIHIKGEDRKKGELVVKNGTKISTPEIGIGASIGKNNVEVAKLPKTLIISTGDELVDIDQSPEDHQIRRSNSHQIYAVLQKYMVDANSLHLDDDFESIFKKLGHAIKAYELIILSGGVSKGKFDYVPKVLEQLGVTKHFHRVKQRPGKPFWFGQHPDNCTFFALPGNPISSFMCTQIYLNRWLEKSLGLTDSDQVHGILDEDVNFKPDLTYFLEVKLSFSEAGFLLASPRRGNGSGDLANLGNGDAFIQLPNDREFFKKGEAYPIFYYR